LYPKLLKRAIDATRCRDGEEAERSELRNVKVLSLPTGQGVIIKP
jgi:hypothetical protein